MLEIEKVDGKMFLVSDDSQAENALLADATEDMDFGMRWAQAPMEDGKLRVEVHPYEAQQVADAIAFGELQHYMTVCEELNAFAKEHKS